MIGSQVCSPLVQMKPLTLQMNQPLLYVSLSISDDPYALSDDWSDLETSHNHNQHCLDCLSSIQPGLVIQTETDTTAVQQTTVQQQSPIHSTPPLSQHLTPGGLSLSNPADRTSLSEPPSISSPMEEPSPAETFPDPPSFNPTQEAPPPEHLPSGPH